MKKERKKRGRKAECVNKYKMYERLRGQLFDADQATKGNVAHPPVYKSSEPRGVGEHSGNTITSAEERITVDASGSE